MPSQPVSAESLQQAAVSGRYAISPKVLAALHDAATTTGAKFETLMASAAVESGFNPAAKAKSSSATGLFQFVDQTWLGLVKQSGADHGLAAQAAAIVNRNGQLTVEDPAMRQEILDLRKDPRVAAAMQGDHLKGLSDKLSQTLGRAPDVAETYLGHFLGAGGAAQMLRALRANPGGAASDVLPEAARANPGMFDGQTVSGFMDKVRGRLGQAYADLGMTMPQGAALNGTGLSGKAVTTADAETGVDGWGAGAPARASTVAERMMLASMSRVFATMDKSFGQRGAGSGKPGQMPAAVVSALDSADGSTTTYTAGM